MPLDNRSSIWATELVTTVPAVGPGAQNRLPPRKRRSDRTRRSVGRLNGNGRGEGIFTDPQTMRVLERMGNGSSLSAALIWVRWTRSRTESE